MSQNVNNFFENVVNGSNPHYCTTSSWTPSPVSQPSATYPNFNTSCFGSYYTLDQNDKSKTYSLGLGLGSINPK